MLEAVRLCQENSWDFSEIFRNQFLLARSRTKPDPSWPSKKIGDWWLHRCPKLPLCRLLGPGGDMLGLVIGIAIDATGQPLTSDRQLDSAEPLETERFIETLAGRFLAILASSGQQRIYFDPTAGITAVYSATHQTVCSNVTLGLDRPIDPAPGIDPQAVMAGQDRLYLGETPDHAFTRVYANHYLDLDRFEMVRHWPKPDMAPEASGLSPQELGERISARLQQVMAGLLNNHRCALPLSAGKDSRILLSAALPNLGKLAHVYSFCINKITRYDCRVAQKLSWEFGFPLQIVARGSYFYKQSFRPPEIDELRRKMALSTGFCANGRDNHHAKTLTIAPGGDITLRGNLCEITRANKYRRPFPEEGFTRDVAFGALMELSPEEAAEKFTPDRLAALRQRYWDWADTLPDAYQGRLIDMAHCEHWLPAVGNTEYLAYTNALFLNPYNDRQLLYWAMCCPPEERKKDALVHAIIGTSDKRLLDTPFLYKYIKQSDAALQPDADLFDL
ncbi:hypothetical protein ACM25N_07485 [Roseovarius sp. C7]|uniref:hypothetical protein n=1 Tax=Roseovarius sp. C7 TaxID=3398643 RepID=UPI0039F6912C